MSLSLKTLNDMHDLPIYGNQPRVKCRNLRGPWQEVELRLFSWEETDTPEFWRFVEDAVLGFRRHTDRVAVRPEDVMPWKKLGKIWHLSRKGFPPGKRIAWGVDLLEELFELLSEVAPEGQFLWNNQTVVRLFVRQQKDAWASVNTKRPSHVDLVLAGPKGHLGLGRVTDLGRQRELDTSREETDVFRLSFRDVEDLQKGDLRQFLAEHLSSLEASPATE